MRMSSTALFEQGRILKVLGGRYGLGSKEFTPTHDQRQCLTIWTLQQPKNHFTVGIVDDVTNHLPGGSRKDRRFS